jgi:hypothetical protein
VCKSQANSSTLKIEIECSSETLVISARPLTITSQKMVICVTTSVLTCNIPLRLWQYFLPRLSCCPFLSRYLRNVLSAYLYYL